MQIKLTALRVENNLPTQHVEAFWHAGERRRKRSERDAQTHHTADTVAMTKRKVICWQGSKILPHKECLVQTKWKLQNKQ